MMKRIFNALFLVLKYILFACAFLITFYGILLTYKRLEKPLSEAIGVFLPFSIILVCFMINILARQKHVNSNIIYNFACILTFLVIIIVGARSLLDTNMVLYFKYGVNFNPSYFADNLSTIQILLYLLSAGNICLMFTNLGKKQKKKVVEAS